MTNKEQAAIFWAVMTNAQLTLDKRQAAYADLLNVKKTSKTSWEKLGISKEVFEAEQQAFLEAEQQAIDIDQQLLNQNDDWVEPLSFTPDYGQDFTQAMPIQAAIEACVDEFIAEGKTIEDIRPKGEPISKPKKPSGDQRGLISAKVRCLLMDTDDSYKLIVEAVKAAFPEANTTTRSVASVAAELRKDGVMIAFRRPAKVVKS